MISVVTGVGAKGQVGEAVAARVEDAAYESGVARRERATPESEF